MLEREARTSIQAYRNAHRSKVDLYEKEERVWMAGNGGITRKDKK